MEAERRTGTLKTPEETEEGREEEAIRGREEGAGEGSHGPGEERGEANAAAECKGVAVMTEGKPDTE